MTDPAPSPGARALSAALTATRRRLALRTGLAAGAGAAVGGVVLLELAWSLGASADALLLLGGGCALAGAGMTALAVRRAAPSVALAAAVLDELLGRGATLATAAEALDGAHARFAPALLAEADAALVAVDLRRLLPLRASAGLLLAAAVAVLWGALLPSARAEPAAPPPRTRTPLVALLGGGAGPAEGEPAAAPSGEVVAVTAAPAADPAGEPAAALAARAPEAAALLQEQLEALLARVPAPGGAPGQADAASPPAPAPAPALDEALRAGDLAAARAELERLAEAAGRGDRAAEARLGELARTLGQALDGAAGSGSAGGAEEPAGPSSRPTPTTTTPPIAIGDAGRDRRPWALDATTRRYFDADPLRSRPPRSTRDTQGTGR